MSDSMLIYVLAVSENFSGMASAVGVLSLCLIMVAAFINAMEAHNYPGGDSKKAFWNVGKHAKYPLLAIVVACFIPSREQLVGAYLLVEGGKVVTAKNGEKVVGEATKRIDRLLDILEKQGGSDDD